MHIYPKNQGAKEHTGGISFKAQLFRVSSGRRRSPVGIVDGTNLISTRRGGCGRGLAGVVQ